MAEEVRFDEEIQPAYAAQTEASFLVRLALATRIASNQEQAQYVLLVVAILAAVLAAVIFFFSGSGGGGGSTEPAIMYAP